MGDNIDQSNVQETKIIQRSVENFTICEQVYQQFYSRVAQYFVTMSKSLPSGDLAQTDDDLRVHFDFIDFNKNISNEEYLNVFCEFHLRKGCFPSSQTLITTPKLKIPSFITTNEIISPSPLFERFQWTNARGLVSIQVLAALTLFLGGNENNDVATGVMTEFLHNMSHQALAEKMIKFHLNLMS